MLGIGIIGRNEWCGGGGEGDENVARFCNLMMLQSAHLSLSLFNYNTPPIVMHEYVATPRVALEEKA